MKKPKNVDEYISSFPEEIQEKLEKIRSVIRKAVPEAEEVISYSMPGYRYKGMLVWFAAFSKHIGFYPKPSGIEAFKKELKGYKGSKGAIQFPFDKPLPEELIGKIVRFRVGENTKKDKKK